MVSVKNKDFWVEFIEQYRLFPCLWDVYSKEYSNKLLREEALQKLADKSKEINPDADKEYVRKRIANLRTSFAREFKKIQGSKRTGCSADEIYETTLWYYDSLSFLKDGEISRKGTSSLLLTSETISDEISFSEDLSSPPQTPDESSYTSNPRSASSCSAKSRKRTLVQEQKNFFEKANEFMTKKEDTEEDEFGILGRRIAAHFRNMKSNQSLIAEKIISDVLIHGRMNQLTMKSKFVLNSDAFYLPEEVNSDLEVEFLQVDVTN